MKIIPIGSTKLVNYLRCFSELEIKRFKNFLESPFHNTSKERIQLFALLKPYHPNYDSIPFTKEKLYKKIYGKSYQKQKMNDLFKSLRILVEDFLIVSDVLKDKKNRQTKLIETFHNRNLPYFKDHSTNLIKQINTQDVKNEEDYFQLYIENKRNYFHITNEQKIKDLDSFIEAHQSLDHFYILAKCKFLTEEFNRKRMFNEQEGLITWPQLEILIPKNILEANPIINTLYQINQLQRNDLPKDFFDALTDQVLNLHNIIEENLLRDLLINLINYGIAKNNTGNDTYNKQCAEIYKAMVDRNILLENGIIRDIEYINISNFAFIYISKDWGEYFCSTYAKYLDSNSRENTQNIALAYKYFFLKDYKKIDIYLEKLNPITQRFYTLRIKGLVMRNLFEDWLYRDIDNLKTLHYQTKNYEQALYRDRKYTGEEKITAYLNFIQVLKKIISLVSEPSKLTLVKVEKIEEEILSREQIIFKAWLQKILAAIKEKFNL